MTRNAVATFKVGSSSLKFSLFTITDDRKIGDCLVRGAIRNLSGPRSIDISGQGDASDLSSAIAGLAEPSALIEAVIAWLLQARPGTSLRRRNAGAHGGR